MQVVVICETFHWTYDEYYNQPDKFLDLIREKMKIDAQKSEKEIKSVKKH